MRKDEKDSTRKNVLGQFGIYLPADTFNLKIDRQWPRTRQYLKHAPRKRFVSLV